MNKQAKPRSINRHDVLSISHCPGLGKITMHTGIQVETAWCTPVWWNILYILPSKRAWKVVYCCRELHLSTHLFCAFEHLLQQPDRLSMSSWTSLLQVSCLLLLQEQMCEATNTSAMLHDWWVWWAAAYATRCWIVFVAVASLYQTSRTQDCQQLSAMQFTVW